MTKLCQQHDDTMTDRQVKTCHFEYLYAYSRPEVLSTATQSVRHRTNHQHINVKHSHQPLSHPAESQQS